MSRSCWTHARAGPRWTTFQTRHARLLYRRAATSSWSGGACGRGRETGGPSRAVAAEGAAEV
eukprot:2765190-Rhodomonas_salina.1